MSIVGFGKPKYGSNTGHKNFKLKDGTNSYRILPPMKSLEETGGWAVYYGTHFGYKGVNPKDPSKPSFRTFKCIRDVDFRTKMVMQDCPECDLIEQQEAAKKKVISDAEREGHNTTEVKELAQPLTDWLSDHNCDRKWHLNVKNKAGEFGVLVLSHKTKKKLDLKIAKTLSEDGIDALDPEQGVWFEFTRTGKGLETNDEVDVEMESVRENGRVVRTVKVAPLSQEEADSALKDCPDLSQTIRTISYEQIALLTQSSGEPEDVDAILALGQKNKEASPSVLPKASAPVTKPAETKAAPEPVVQKAEEPQAAAEAAAPEDDEEAQLVAALAASRAKKAAAAVAAAAPKEAVQAKSASAPGAGAPGALNREKFMDLFKK